MGKGQVGPKQNKQTMIGALKRAFELNRFDYMAADALALTYNVSGSQNAELTALWERRRDQAMADISIDMQCATKNNRLLSHACERTFLFKWRARLTTLPRFRSVGLLIHEFVHTCRSWGAESEHRPVIHLRVRSLASRCGVNINDIAVDIVRDNHCCCSPPG